jgi:hypothetical protein
VALAAALGAAPATVAAAEAGDAPLIAVPSASVGAWSDLGYFLAPWLAGDAPIAADGASAPTRLAGLRRDDGRWLAIVLVQVAPVAAPCPAPTALHITDDASGCLRMRADADFDRWLQQQHAALYHWLDAREWTSRPRAWISYRTVAGGRTIETHALIDPTLLEPTTLNNVEFLAGGQPARQWARRLAAAARAAGAGSALTVPPFPFAPQVAFAPPPEPAEPTAAAIAPPAEVISAPVRPLAPPAPAGGGK